MLLSFLEYSLQFVQALKHAPSDDDVKAVLGEHMMALHRRCAAIKVAFAHLAHATGKYHDCCCLRFIILNILLTSNCPLISGKYNINVHSLTKEKSDVMTWAVKHYPKMATFVAFSISKRIVSTNSCRAKLWASYLNRV